MINPLAREKYHQAADKVSNLLLKQEAITLYLMNKTGLDFEEIKQFIQKSVTVMTFSTLLGWDFGYRVNRLEAIRGAAIGATIGFCLVLGELTIKIVFRKAESGIELDSVDIAPAEEVTYA